MTKLSFVALFILYSSFAIANCQYYDGTKTTTVSEGTSVSLRDPGKSLDNMTIQDQDGLGTCYANATTTILKSILPDHPDISYTHAAIMGTTRGWQENWNSPNKKYVTKQEKNINNFTGGGWVCETIAGMKKSGGACPKSLSATENKLLWDSDIQERLLNGLGSYFDNMNLIKNDPLKFEALKNDLSLAIEAINVEKSALVQQCEERKSSKFPVFFPLKYLFEESFHDHLAEPTKCSQAKTDALKKLLSSDSKIEVDRLDIKPSALTMAYFTDMLESDPQIVKDFESFNATSNANAEDYPELSKHVGQKLNELLLTLLPDEEVKNGCPTTQPGQSPFINDEMDQVSTSFIFQIKYHKNNPCVDLLQPYALNYLLDPNKNPNSCLAPTNVEMIMAAIKPLMELEVPINQDLIPTLLNPESRYADQIVRAIMPGCLDQSKLIGLDNVSCAGFPFCDRTGGFNDSFTYSGPAGGCYGFEHARKMVRTKSLIGINQGRALGISVCTAFMNQPDIKTNFCSGGLPQGEKHNFHEMAITGYRCKDDKIEFELTNSWGSRCGDNKNIECQKDKDEYYTGPFWVKEETLVDSTRDITTITVKKK
jgi:hypothetical protein